MAVKTNALKKIANRVADFILKKKQLGEAKKVWKLNRNLDTASLWDKAMREENIPAYLRRWENGFGTNNSSIYENQWKYFLRWENWPVIPWQNLWISNTKTTDDMWRIMRLSDKKIWERLKRPAWAVDTPYNTINWYWVSPAAQLKDVVRKKMYKTWLKFWKNWYTF